MYVCIYNSFFFFVKRKKESTRLLSERNLDMLLATRLSSSKVQHDTCIALPQPRFHGLGYFHFARGYYENPFCFLFF